ncbi:hypothetical protein HWC80_gp039 [Mycobacterium phage Indlulamithi]|uniref:Uncharacterized protein n=1 Tax=Mycobacterium phage Indlulamithi TaxID=2656582 RepID=A0A649VCK1_9CAUD|nr:hypothetical protein HWC80_gp039 [Mycobacterium phage Indlulamithi]QGJ90080.1 hypothetical protein PBI_INDLULAMITHI_39 [Mycobacterium phage Indlulamithi]
MTEPAEIESVPLQPAAIGLNMDPETASYVGMLEGTIAALVISDVKNRTLLELLTGDGWEAARVDFNGDALIGLAVSALVKQTGMSTANAKILVMKRWAERNHPADYIIPQAVSIDQMTGNVPTSGQDVPAMSERVKAWRAKQQAEIAELSSAATDSASETPSGASDLEKQAETGTNVPE